MVGTFLEGGSDFFLWPGRDKQGRRETRREEWWEKGIEKEKKGRRQGKRERRREGIGIGIVVRTVLFPTLTRVRRDCGTDSSYKVNRFPSTLRPIRQGDVIMALSYSTKVIFSLSPSHTTFFYVSMATQE